MNAPSERTTVRRVAARAAYDPATLHAILDEGLVCQVGIVQDGSPVVVPMAYARDGDRLLFHGSHGSRLIRALTAGNEVCAQVTLVDGMVLARSWFHHSMNYRSVTVFGRPRAITDPSAKLEALERIVEGLAPGRGEASRAPTEEEVRGTAVVELSLAEASAKVRTGPPKDEEADLALPHWAGVVPLTLAPGSAEADEFVPVGRTVPEHVRALRQPVETSTHGKRPFRFLELMEETNWRLKLVGITSHGEHPDAELVEAARRTVRGYLQENGGLEDSYGVGFVGIHEGKGANFVFLDRWFRGNELHHVVWISPKEAPGNLRRSGESDGSVCVWDLHLQYHERAAWLRYGMPANRDLDAYLGERMDAEG